MLGRVVISILLRLGILAGPIWGQLIAVPNRLNPFTPLRIADEVAG